MKRKKRSQIKLCVEVYAQGGQTNNDKEYKYIEDYL